MHTLKTHWIDIQSYKESLIHTQATATILQDRRMSTWYRRLWFYFFESEITARVRTETSTHVDADSLDTLFANPELQALAQRSGLQYIYSGLRDAGDVANQTAYTSDSTLDMTALDDIVHDYIYSRDIYTSSTSQSTKDLATHIYTHLHRYVPEMVTRYSTDMIMQATCARESVRLAQATLAGEYTYQSFLQACLQYIYTYQAVPLFFAGLDILWTQAGVLSIFDETTHTRLTQRCTQPYTIQAHIVSQVKPFGALDEQTIVYSSPLARLGLARSGCPWYVKILVLVSISMLGGYVGGWSLFVLPVFLGFIQYAKTKGDYLRGLVAHLGYVIHNAQAVSDNHSLLYTAMIDPVGDADDSLTAQKTLMERYDVLPFDFHHELTNTTAIAQDMLAYMRDSIESGSRTAIQPQRETVICQIQAYKNHGVPLFVNQNNLYTEQAYNRMIRTIAMVAQTIHMPLDIDVCYQSCTIIDNTLTDARGYFATRVSRHAIYDALLATGVSATTGFLSSYLLGRGSKASAASISTSNLPTMTMETIHLPVTTMSDSSLIDSMQTVMGIEHTKQFLDTVSAQTSRETVWDTMIDLFGHHDGAIYTAKLMDSFWKITDSHGQSLLLETALTNGLPTTANDTIWPKLMSFLDTIYDYDNLGAYHSYIDKQSLLDIFHKIDTGAMSYADIAALPLEQREIISNAAFYFVHKQDFAGLFAQTSVVTDMTIPVISFVATPDTITTVDTGSISIGTISTGTSIDLTINKWFAGFARPTFARPSFTRPSIDMPTFTLPSIHLPTRDIGARRDKITHPHITVPTIDIDLPSIQTGDIIHKTDISGTYNTDAGVIAPAKYISVGGEKITGSILSGKLTTGDEILGPIGKNFYASIKGIMLPWISPSKRVKVV